MIKEYCDICGEEKHTSKYKLPMYKRKPITSGNEVKIMEYSNLVPGEVDVCTDCASLIGSVTGGCFALRKKNDISGLNINDGVISIKIERVKYE